MKIKLEKHLKLSGDKASIYIVYLFKEDKTLLEIFIEENKNLYINELKQLFDRLKAIGKNTGARSHYFKNNEGKPGDGVCALYDEEESNLRLYCIKYGCILLIVGGGGSKSKDIKAFQEDDKLTKENYFLRDLSKEITKRMKEGDLKFINEGMDFDGDLEFEF